MVSLTGDGIELHRRASSRNEAQRLPRETGTGRPTRRCLADVALALQGAARGILGMLRLTTRTYSMRALRPQVGVGLAMSAGVPTLLVRLIPIHGIRSD